jgi:hypothetical protein
VEPFTGLTAAELERLPGEARRIGEVLGAKTVTVDECRVAVRPHL